MSDKNMQNIFDFLLHDMRSSDVFKRAFMTCNNSDLVGQTQGQKPT